MATMYVEMDESMNMSNPPSPGKFMIPALPSTVLHRQALFAALAHVVDGSVDRTAMVTERTGYKVILLCAPAGYGKTTILTDFAKHTHVPCCWYFLDATDRDAVTFLELLITSIRQCFPSFGAALDSQLRDLLSADSYPEMYQHLETFIDKLTAAIATEIPEPLALILCNYHEVNQEQKITDLLNYFIQQMPPQCVLILESRSAPKLDLVPLLAHSQIFGITSNELRFSIQEIQQLAQLQQVSLTDHEAELLEQSFEGWITGILLSNQLGNLNIPLSNLRYDITPDTPVVKMGQEHLFAYFVKDVFAHDPDAYTFLKETAVLRRMTPALCDALLNVTDAASRLSYLEGQGLFVTHYGAGDEQYFVCHRVLRELLYRELEYLTPEHLVELHLRAVDLFRGVQDDEAVFHALAAKAFGTAAQLIECVAEQQFAQGQLTTLAGWIDALPLETTTRYVRLLLTRANIFLEESDLAGAQPLLDRALASIREDSATTSLQAELLLVQAKMRLQQGDYPQTRNLCHQVLTQLPADEISLRATAHQLLGSYAAYVNDFTGCIAELQQALQLYGYDVTIRQVAKLHTMLANFYGIIGHNALSEHHRTRATQCWENLHDEWGKIDNLIGQGAIKQRQGALEEAQQFLTQALSTSHETIYYKCGQAYALANLGNLYQDQNQLQQALSAYEDSLVLSRQLNETYLICYIICQLAMTYLLLGDPHSALQIISQLDQDMLQVEPPYSYEQALYTLTTGTILLYLQRYEEAYTHLSTAESVFTDAKYEQIQSIVRVAACLFAQGKRQVALQRTEEAISLAKQYNYEELIHRELGRAPDLLNLLKTSEQALVQSLLLGDEITRSNTLAAVQDLPPATSFQELPRLRILALGAPAVYINDLLITHWRMTRSMELFFLLLNTPHPLHKEQIITLLWPDIDEQINQKFRSTVHYLRKALGTSCVISLNGAYALHLDSTYDVWYDVDAFQDQYAQAQTALAAKDNETAGQALEKMLKLYQGDYLKSFYSDWCASTRDKLCQMYIDAHRQLALIAWQQQQLEKCIYHWQYILTIDNSLEAAHEGLMLCYLRQGKRTLALRQYHHCSTLLHDELGATPGQAIQSLYQQIIKDS